MQPEATFSQLADAIANAWRVRARPEQLPPAGAWAVWLLMAGRGFGKTRTGAEWVQEQVVTGAARRIGLVAPTASDARDVMIEGESGLLAIAPRGMRPEYEPSKRRLTWPNGAIATAFSADEPERLRGPQFDAGWCDEAGAWRDPGAWDMFQFGLRLGRHPRCVVTATPKPSSKIIRDLLAREGNGVIVTRGRTRDNAENLAPGFLDAMEKRYGGTRLGRQELEGEMLIDVPGALWRRDWIDADRVTLDSMPELRRVVVAIDPAVSTGEGSDETGIVVAGSAASGDVYVLGDYSGKYGPAEWAREAVRAYHRHRADRIVAEVNNGGQLVEATLRNVDSRIPFKQVHASRGKAIRAEPVSALYEQHRVHHVGSFETLEDQQVLFTSDFDRARAGYSPDRVDALVWAVTEVMNLRQPMHISAESIERVRMMGARQRAMGLSPTGAPLFGGRW